MWVRIPPSLPKLWRVPAVVLLLNRKHRYWKGKAGASLPLVKESLYIDGHQTINGGPYPLRDPECEVLWITEDRRIVLIRVDINVELEMLTEDFLCFFKPA